MKIPTTDWKWNCRSCLCDYPITCLSIGLLIGNERPSRTSLWSKGLLKMLYFLEIGDPASWSAFCAAKDIWKCRSCLSDHLTICLSIWLSNEHVDYRLKRKMPFLFYRSCLSDHLTIDWIENCQLTIEIDVPVYRSCLTVPVNSRGLRCVCQSLSILVRKGAFPGVKMS